MTGPVRLVDVELTRPLPDIEAATPELGGAYAETRVLVRLHGRPLGTVALRPGGEELVAGFLADAVWSELSEAIGEHCAADGLAVPEKLPDTGLEHVDAPPCSWRGALEGVAAPFVSVVVTTCGGSDTRLAATLRDVLDQTYPRLEVVVVDNRPQTSGVPGLLATEFPGDDRIRYAAEARPGLAHARNRGAAEARGEIVAFTDDDVTIDPEWIGSLVAGFDAPRVACVTGLILPLELETPAQCLLEEFGGYAKGLARRRWDLDEHRLDHPLYPYTVGAFGSGANAAFRAGALTAIGGFDGALGAGTKARGGEDIDIYVTCVQRGFQIVYEPAAIVRHAHLREMAQVEQKIRDYGVGLGAMLTKQLLGDWRTAAAILGRVPAGAVHLLSGRSTKNAGRSGDYPRSLVLAELQGLLLGPAAYLRSRASS
ncbi:MAG: glycosyltransferase [Actinomycetota bacterium]|nr:glycosyltransferase [Actinomycetota bacterium]